MARTPKKIAAERAAKEKKKRDREEVVPREKNREHDGIVTRENQSNEEVLHSLLTVNLKLAAVSKKISKMQIDLSTILVMNKDITALAKEVSVINNDFACALSKWEETEPSPSKNKRMRCDSSSFSSSCGSYSSDYATKQSPDLKK